MRQKTKGKNTHCTSPCVLGGGLSTTANVIIARQLTNIWKSSLRLLLRDTKLQQQIAPIYQRLPLSLYECTLASFNLHCAQQAATSTQRQSEVHLGDVGEFQVANEAGTTGQVLHARGKKANTKTRHWLRVQGYAAPIGRIHFLLLFV